MAQQLRPFVEDLGSVSSTLIAQPSLILVPGNLLNSQGHQPCMWYTYVHMSKTLIYICII